MTRMKMSLWMLAATAVAVAVLVTGSIPPAPTEARIVTVACGTITDSAALAGRLAYADETILYAAVPGLVSQVYVTPGQRVAAGEALLRMASGGYEAAVAAWLSAGQPEDALPQALEGTVVRAPADATVRRILTAEHAAVTAGTPVALLSSNRQEIRCTAAEADVRRIRPGMWARLSAGGEELDRLAVVTAIGDLEADPVTGLPVCTVTLLPDQPIELPAGAAIDADVYLDGREDVPILPLEAITARGTVWWVDDERCTEIPVKTVLNDEMNAWVDLPEGTRVAVGEFEEGQRVAEVAP